MTSTSASPTHDLLFAEELLLLALSEVKGRDTTRGIGRGLAGGLLLDLAAGGWIDSRDGRLVLVPDRPAPGERVLAEALAAIAARRKARDARHWVLKLPGQVKPINTRVAERLVELGILADARRRRLGLVNLERFPEVDPEPERALRRRLAAELTGTAEVSARTALLAPILVAYNLTARIVAKDDRKQAKQRAKAITEDPGKLGAAVRSALGTDSQWAAYAAIGAAVSSDGGGGGGCGGGGCGGGG